MVTPNTKSSGEYLKGNNPMADLLHCMLCFAKPSGRHKFFISSCGHTFCHACVAESLKQPWTKCKKCEKDGSRLLEINSALPPEVRDLFLPLDQTLNNFIKDINRTLDFQSGHRNRLMKQLQTKRDQFDKLQNFCKNEMKKKDAYKQEMMKLQEFKKKAVQSMQERNKAGETPSKKPPHNSTILASNFQTPGPGAHRSFITSTPIVNDTLNISQNDVSMSFSAATGIAYSNEEGIDDVDILVSGTSNCKISSKVPDSSMLLNSIPPVSKKRSIERSKFVELKENPTPPTFKTPIVKKTRLDVGEKSHPLPVKRT